MATATVRLPEALQALVDSRLDTIDRMLLGRVPRQDRVAIVGEVEAQIHELLRGRDANELGRDDVLAVLARLDPPEAYLTEGAEVGAVSRSPRPSYPPARPSPRVTSGTGTASGILGVVSLAMIFLCGLLIQISGGDLSSTLGGITVAVAWVSVAAVPIMGLTGLVLGAYSRFSSGWGVFGLVAGIVSLLTVMLALSFELL